MTLSEDEIRRIVAAAETIEASLDVLTEYQSLSREEYGDSRESRDVVERRFVKATEAALDIAETLVRHLRDKVPDSNPGTMQALAEEDVVSSTTAESMAKATRFRNVLAHTYGDVIDDDIVYTALQDLQRYRDFLYEVRVYLREIDAFDE